MGIVKITPAGEKINCRAGEKANFQFSVSNASGGPLRVGIDVRADGEAGKWLSVQGSVERDLSEGVDTTIAVEVKPPKNLLPESSNEQTYTFRLRVYDAQNTETAEDSATVSVTVKPAQQEQKSCLWCWLIPVITVTVIAIGVTVWLISKPRKMEDYTGQRIATVEVELSGKFDIGLTEVISDKEPGTIVSQTPAGGEPLAAPVEAGGKPSLSLTISAVSVSVPNVIGKTVAEAQDAIENLGLVVGEIKESPTVSRGFESIVVADQMPKGDTAVMPETAVALFIPSQDVTVPSVKGLKFEEAQTALEQLGLRVTMETRSTGQTQQGLIFAQTPLEGAVVKLGDSIKVMIEKTTVKVPSVVGQTPANARRILERLGLNVQTKSAGRVLTEREVKVTSQTNTNKTVDIGTVVIISYPSFGLVKDLRLNTNQILLERVRIK